MTMPSKRFPDIRLTKSRSGAAGGAYSLQRAAD
jgi:hypothetical protein